MSEEKDKCGGPSLAYSLIVEQAKSNKRMCWLNFILIALLFASNMAWLYQWCQYDYVSETTTVTVDSGESGQGDAIYQSGEGNIANGKSDGSENKTD